VALKKPPETQPVDAEFEDIAQTVGIEPGAEDLAIALVKNAQSRYLKPPPWVAELQKELRETRSTIENATLDSGEKAAAQAHIKKLRRDMTRTTEAFEHLRSFVETGQACHDCVSTRQNFVNELLATLHDAQTTPVYNGGDAYATRQHAFQAGFFHCATLLREALGLRQNDYINGQRTV